MANFMLIYNGGSGMAPTPAEQAAVMQAWGAWFTQLGPAVVDGGNPFAPAVKHIAASGAVSDGSSGATATGYSILKADSLDGAVEMSKGCPVLLSGGQISVYEIFPAM